MTLSCHWLSLSMSLSSSMSLSLSMTLSMKANLISLFPYHLWKEARRWDSHRFPQASWHLCWTPLLLDNNAPSASGPQRSLGHSWHHIHDQHKTIIKEKINQSKKHCTRTNTGKETKAVGLFLLKQAQEDWPMWRACLNFMWLTWQAPTVNLILS